MKLVALLLAGLLLAASAFGDEGSSIPWTEFKTLYRDSIERELTKAPAPAPQVYAIESARYTLEVGGENARGEVTLSGKVVSGAPAPIPLFSRELVITGIKDIAGGSVIGGTGDEGLCLLPDGSSEVFQLTVTFLARAQEDNRSRCIAFGIPPALTNGLTLTLPPDTRLAEAPGLAGPDGTYYLPSGARLSVKYLDAQALAAARVTEVDAVSRIGVQKNRIRITTFFVPVHALPGALTLQAPRGAQYAASSLRASQVKPLGEDRFELALPENGKEAFSVEFTLDLPGEQGEVSFPLPQLQGNSGQQGRFILDEPDDKQLTATAAGLVSPIPVERLGDGLPAEALQARSYATVPVDEPITLIVKNFQAVSTPATVAETQYFFTSFEENGNTLSVLALDAPGDIGPRMTLKAVPDAEIWSLTVNGTKRKVFSSDPDTWILPLDAGPVSHVELAFLKRGPKLGLQGRLEIAVPETGLLSHDVRIGVALPNRVELLSMEGPVSAAVPENWQVPTEFVGKPYYFSRAFYKGEGMRLAVAYKEPLNPAQAGKGGAQ